MAKIEPGYIDSMRPRGGTDDRIGQPRRWAWWFGAPWLVLGVAAWWLKSERLVDVALVFFACACLMLVVDGFRTGAIEGHWAEKYHRDKDASSFWSAAALYCLLAILMLLSLVFRLFGTTK